MPFKYQEYRELMLAAILGAYRGLEGEIAKIPVNSVHNKRFIDGVAVYLIPDDRFGIYLRDSSDPSEVRYSLGDWKYELDTDRSEVKEVDAVLEYVADIFEEELEEEGDDPLGQAIVHLSYLGTAEALLDPRVTQVLNSHLIDARDPFDLGDINPAVERIVLNVFGHVPEYFNYCQLVRCNRYTKSIIGDLL